MQEQQYSTSINHPNSYTSKLCEKLLTFSETGQFSDICIISSDDVKFHSHKNILSAASDYFMAMFGGSLKESSSTQVKIHNVSGKVLKLILTFVYTGKIELQSEMVEEILKGAIFFQIQSLITECYNLMAEKLDAKNCLKIGMFADQYDLLELYKKVSKFASLNFDKITNEEDFLKLNEKQLSEIISSEELCVSSEENVYLNLIKWIDHDKLNREQSAVKLFSKVRYWLLSLNFVKEHRSKLPFQAECLELVCTWFEWHSLPDNCREIKPVVFSKPMKPGLLFVGGGKIQKYDEELNIWTRESFPNLPNDFHSVLAFRNILVFGYYNKPATCFDLQTREVTNLPKRNVNSENLCFIVLNDELYIISNDTRLVEKYNFSTGKWYNVSPMNTVFSGPRAAVANGKLYVTGSSPSIMDIFNPDTNDWTSVRVEDVPKWNFGFTEVGGKLYKIGGRQNIGHEQYSSKYTYFKNIKQYDPINNTWEEKEQMRIALAGLHCASWNNRLIICGGVDDTSRKLNLVQEYDPDTNKWKTLSPLVEYRVLPYYGLVVLN